MSGTMKSHWVGVRDAAAILGTSEASVRADAKRGSLPTRKIGKSKFEFHRADLERIVANGLGPEQGAASFDAQTAASVAKMLRIMELESRIERDRKELASLR